MPKTIEYPRDSFARAMELADAVDSMGGDCKSETCADKLGRKVSGSFNATVGAAIKHDLVSTKKSILSITETYKKIKRAYNPNERIENMRAAFLSPPLYRKIFEKFKGKELPKDMLANILIREHEVEESRAAKVVNFFIEGAKDSELLIDGKIVGIANGGIVSAVEQEGATMEDDSDRVGDGSNGAELLDGKKDSGEYAIHIYGPGMTFKLTLTDGEDFIILEAMINKLKKKVVEKAT